MALYALENFNSIYEALNYLKVPEDIEREFPSILDYSSMELLEALKVSFSEKLEEYEQNEEDFRENELLFELYETEVKLFKAKISLCKKRINQIKEEENKKNEEITYNKKETAEEKKVIFAKSSSGRIYALQDINKLPLEEAFDIKEAFYYLLNDVGDGNPEIKRGLKNHAKLSKILETKKFQMRIYYQSLGQNLYYVMGIYQKKDNTSKEMENYLENRKKNTANEKRKMEELFRRTDEKSIQLQNEILNESKEILDGILARLDERIK